MLILTEGPPGSWERFQQIPPAPDLAGGSLVLPRWQRARALGVHADGLAVPLGVSNRELESRRELTLDGLREGHPVLDALEAEVTPRGLLTLLTDADGVIVRARGGALFPDAVRSTRLVEGARWDEQARGTNAIGTAIAEAQPVAVVGRAHFETANHGLFCYAAPVCDPFGERVAVLDVSGPLKVDDTSIGAAVRRAALALEDALRVHAYARSQGHSREFLERMVERSHDPALLLEAPGRLRAMNAAAAAEFDGEGARTVERLFGTTWRELVRDAAHGAAVFETRRRRFRVEFEPVRGPKGRTLALVCFLTREGSRGRLAAARKPATGSRALPPSFATILGSDPRVVAAKALAAQLAPSELPMMLLAETGTGKELFARAIHAASRRAAAPLVVVNCGAMTSSLLDSELFGYAPGAFTGASRNGAQGKLAAAHGGTLFLDEVAEMPASSQAMLLRFLEDGTYSRVGEATPRKADVRLVCATCRDLPALVLEGSFRKDLFFRVQGGCVRLPPLRERQDRLELARALLRQCGEGRREAVRELGPSAEAWVVDHPWPGNVRELRTALLHALALADHAPGAALSVEHFPEPLMVATPLASDLAEPPASRQRALRGMAEAALVRAGGNLSAAARELGVARSTLYRMLDLRG